MHRFLRFLLVSAALFGVFFSGAQSKKLIVKLDRAIPYSQSIGEGRGLSVPELEFILGEHSGNMLIGRSTYRALIKRASESAPLAPRAKANDLFRKIEDLRKIVVIDYDRPISELVAAGKIASLDFVEYAEPYPERFITETPNDSLFAEQYYLEKIRAVEAWDFIEGEDKVLVGICDTGIDYLHEDLAENIYENPGETGTDEFGEDKRTNGIDDDDNGFVDDWRGWDFAGADGSAQDNDPMPGHMHGTHVGGAIASVTNNVIGCSGAAKNAVLLPVKVGFDNWQSRSIYNGYEGILYAAAMGCKVINCSWGGPSKSQAEMETLDMAVAMGAVVVGAAGNDYAYSAAYPASHPDAVSVVALEESDRKALFSNYHPTSDVAAYGSRIMAPVPGNNYGYLDGTSMASPIAAAVAAMIRLKYPEYDSRQTIERLKATCADIEDVNLPQFKGLMGRGRVDALDAVSAPAPKSVFLVAHDFDDEDGDYAYDAGDEIRFSATVSNALTPLAGCYAKLENLTSYEIETITDSVYIGDFSTGDTIELSEPFVFSVTEEFPLDYSLKLGIRIYDEAGFINREAVALTVRPSYITIDSNKIKTTINSAGNIAFNDYPNNVQGEGFTFDGSANLLYEGALMIAVSDARLADAARGTNQNRKDEDFEFISVAKINSPGEIADLEADAVFDDTAASDPPGVLVKQSVYQFAESDKDNFIITVYDVVNQSGEDFDSLFVALFFDWDVGPSGANNIVKFDNEGGFGLCYNREIDSLPQVGAAMLSSHSLNFFAIDNDGGSLGNPGIYDGFTRLEKWYAMSSGLARIKSNIGDASMVIGAGPVRVKAGDTTRAAFSLFAGANYEELARAAEQSRNTAKFYELADGEYNKYPERDSLVAIYPNPTSGKVRISVGAAESGFADLDIYDAAGKQVAKILDNRYVTAGYIDYEFDASGLSQGAYYVRFRTFRSEVIGKFVVGR